MATKKPLTVPQNGTQPAEIKTPMDNMISGTTTAKSTVKNRHRSASIRNF